MGIGVALGLVRGGGVCRSLYGCVRVRSMLRRPGHRRTLLEDELPDGVAPKLRDLQETFRYASAQGNAGWAWHLARLFAKFSRERDRYGWTIAWVSPIFRLSR